MSIISIIKWLEEPIFVRSHDLYIGGGKTLTTTSYNTRGHILTVTSIVALIGLAFWGTCEFLDSNRDDRDDNRFIVIRRY